MFIFPDRENTGNLLKYIYLPPTRGNFEILKIKGCTKVVVGCLKDVFNFVVNFELANWEMECSHCDYSL